MAVGYMPLRLEFHRRQNETRHQGGEGDCGLRLHWVTKVEAWTAVLPCSVGGMSMV